MGRALKHAAQMWFSDGIERTPAWIEAEYLSTRNGSTYIVYYSEDGQPTDAPTRAPSVAPSAAPTAMYLVRAAAERSLPKQWILLQAHLVAHHSSAVHVTNDDAFRGAHS